VNTSSEVFRHTGRGDGLDEDVSEKDKPEYVEWLPRGEGPSNVDVGGLDTISEDDVRLGNVPPDSLLPIY